jgi:uncharacterized protein
MNLRLTKASLTLIAFLISTLIISPAYTQDKNTKDIIAEGGARMKISPDIATFTLTVEKTDTVETRAIEKLNQEVEALTKALVKIGFTHEAIRISDFDVSSSVNDENQKKYTSSNALKLELTLDTKLINKIYNVLQTEKLSDLDIAFDTRISDSLEKKTRRLLVQRAIADAKANADNIAKALNIKIVGVKQVSKYAPALFDQNKIEIVKFTPPQIVGDTDIRYNTSFDKFQVEEVEIEEKITIIFEISK